MADISSIITPDDNEYYFKDTESRGSIQNIIERNDYFEGIVSDMLGFTYTTRGFNLTQNGVTVETTPTKLKIYGTATANRYVAFLNGNNSIKTTVSAFSKTLDAGTYNIETDMTGYQTTYAFRGTYVLFSDNDSFVIADNSTKNVTITFTDPVMIGLFIKNGRNFGTVDDPTYVSFSARRVA